MGRFDRPASFRSSLSCDWMDHDKPPSVMGISSPVDADEASPMLTRIVLAVSAILMLAPSLQAKDCPVQESGLDAREDAIRKAVSCKEALEIMDACAYGAGGDTGL